MVEGDETIRPIVALRLVNPASGKAKETYALMDTGSDRDVVDERLIEELDIRTTSRMMNVAVLGVAELGPREIAAIRIESIEGGYEAEVENALLVYKCCYCYCSL